MLQKTTKREFRLHCARPERVAWVVAKHGGKTSICPVGWKMNTSGNPTMMAVSIAPQRFTHQLITESGQFVIAWPGEDLAEATLFCGTKSGRDVDKFAELGLTKEAADEVDVPLVGECIANLECRLAGTLETGDHTLFAGEIVATWVNSEPKRQLCSIDGSSGYEFLLEGHGYRFGVVKE